MATHLAGHDMDPRDQSPAIHRGDRGFELAAAVWLPRPIDEVFAFFCDAANLETLTPPWLRFEVLTPTPIEMRVGTLIDYRLRVRGIPLRWQSRITAWDPPHRFADLQVRGPYRLWDHQHMFAEKDGGTLCGDHVVYAVFGGTLVNRLLVAPDIQRIFRYRQEKLRALFEA